MPQMMPINWLFSFLLFISIFILFNMLNYYNFKYSTHKNISKIKIFKTSLYWKW